MMKWIEHSWKQFEEEKTVKRLLLVGGGMYVGLWLLVLLTKGILPGVRIQMPPEFPLFYSLPRGKEQLIGMRSVYGVLSMLGGVVFMDFLLGWLLLKRWRVLAYILFWTGILSVLLLGFSLVRVYLLVG